MKKLTEINYDGLVGPTHNYAGLAYGDVASMEHAHQESNPKAAALQGLQKMRACLDLGLAQGIFLPHYRPAWFLLQALGFNGDEQKGLEKLATEDEHLFSAVFSASSMWAANAATVTPSTDTIDQRCHLTAANLSRNLHRAIEADFTYQQLQRMFDDTFVTAHPPIPFGTHFSDEGAANHTRLTSKAGERAFHVFVFGKAGEHYPARQSVAASQAIVREHGIDAEVIYLQQHPDAIDAGVFHNDVIAVGNESVYLYHEQAYVDDGVLQDLQEELQLIKISNGQLGLEDAVATYFFNSQLVTLHDQNMALLLPRECEQHARAKALVDELIVADNPITQAIYVDCRQSMHNGGGPACLRLRVQLDEQELATANPAFLVDSKKITELEKWVEKYYRDRLTTDDFLDKQFRETCMNALDELTQLLEISSIYPFQR
jgi:succinylarginine dihydrolase